VSDSGGGDPAAVYAPTRGVGVIFAVALVVRLVHICQIRRAPFFTVLLGDSRAYDEWAGRIAAGDWIGHDVFYQAPLYPYFLASIYAAAGRNLLLVRVLQACVGSAACVLLALAVRRLVSVRAGLAAGLMLALYAPAIFFDGLIQKSVLDVFFICLVLYLIARITTVRLKADTTGARRDRTTGSVRLQPDLNWLALGLTIGGLSLTRENAMVFTVVLAAWALAHARRAAATFLAGAAIVLLPVAARNSLVGGGFYVTTAQFGPNFYIGNNPQSDGAYQPLRFGRGAPEYERQDATEIAERALGRRLTPAEVSRYWTDRALDFITSRPGAWVQLVARKAALLVNATEMLDTESQETHGEWSMPLRMAARVGHFGVLVPLAALGIIALWPDRSRLAIVYALLGAYAASVLMFYVFARYRYPLVPLLIVFAAAAVTRRWTPGFDRKTVAPVLAVLAPVAVIANWPLVSTQMNRAVTEHNLGAALQSDGRTDEALAHYRRAIALRPDYAPAYNNLGSALRATGRLEDAVANYRRALALRPDYPEAHYNLANAFLDAGRPEQAAEHFQVAMRSMPVAADVHNNLGIALAAGHRLPEAVEQFRQALAADPDSVKAHRNLGDALMTLGSQPEALEHLNRAAHLAPLDAAIQYDFGSALLEAGRLDEAVAAFRAALRLTPESVETHNNLGIALGSQGKVDEAIAEFQAALRIRPDFSEARRNLAMARAARR
jgi:tetratricopeptide (TPR) repeat protein